MARIVLPRRRVLQGIGAAAGLAACGERGSTTGPSKTSQLARGKIDTVVLLMMENRSFDHYFGSLSLLEGRTDVDGLQPGMSNPDLDGNPVPIALTTQMCVEPDPPHGWDTSRGQLDGGTCDGFVRTYLEERGLGAPAGNPMAYHTRETLPISYALADRYALCQRWFSSVLTSTWPNRLYFHAAQSQGIPGNDLPPGGKYTCRTLWHQLDDAGIEWAYYFTDLPTLGLWGNPDWAHRMNFIETFYAEAAAGILPPVVCVDAGAAYNDDHPPHHPLLGQLFIGSIYQALASSPHWDRCLFVLTYDEAGGFFDHVPPGTVRDDYADQGFDQLGFRVPAVVMGPYVKNVVSDATFDHPSALRLVQDLFGIDERLNVRNEDAGDLSVVLDDAALAANTPGAPIELPAIERSEEEIEAECEGLGGGGTGQPELRDFVRSWWPAGDRTADLPGVARGLWRTWGEQGLWIPADR